jgi:hypothetical protein
LRLREGYKALKSYDFGAKAGETANLEGGGMCMVGEMTVKIISHFAGKSTNQRE